MKSIKALYSLKPFTNLTWEITGCLGEDIQKRKIFISVTYCTAKTYGSWAGRAKCLQCSSWARCLMREDLITVLDWGNHFVQHYLPLLYLADEQWHASLWVQLTHLSWNTILDRRKTHKTLNREHGVIPISYRCEWIGGSVSWCSEEYHKSKFLGLWKVVWRKYIIQFIFMHFWRIGGEQWFTEA